MGGGHVKGQYTNPDEDTAGHQDQHQLHRPIFLGAIEVSQVKGGRNAPQPGFTALKVGAAAPNPNQQVHRQHRQFIEEEEEEEVLHHKDAENAGTQGQ